MVVFCCDWNSLDFGVVVKREVWYLRRRRSYLPKGNPENKCLDGSCSERHCLTPYLNYVFEPPDRFYRFLPMNFDFITERTGQCRAFKNVYLFLDVDADRYVCPVLNVWFTRSFGVRQFSAENPGRATFTLREKSLLSTRSTSQTRQNRPGYFSPYLPRAPANAAKRFEYS